MNDKVSSDRCQNISADNILSADVYFDIDLKYIISADNILSVDIFWHRSELTLFDLLLKKRRSKTHNYNWHSKKFPLCQSEKFVWHTRLNRVAETNSYYQKLLIRATRLLSRVGDIFFFSYTTELYRKK